MNPQECLNANCEFLFWNKFGEYFCKDTGSDVSHIDGCGIVWEHYKKEKLKPKKREEIIEM